MLLSESEQLMSVLHAYSGFHFTLRVTNLKVSLVKTFVFADDEKLFFDCFLFSKTSGVCLTTYSEMMSGESDCKWRGIAWYHAIPWSCVGLYFVWMYWMIFLLIMPSKMEVWSIFNINQTNPKAIFLVRLRYSNRKLTRKLFHNRQTKLSGYSTTDRIKPSGYSSLLFRWLFHNAFNLKGAQRMGMKIQSYTLSHNNHKQVPSRQVPLHKREDDERVWLSWNN